MNFTIRMSITVFDEKGPCDKRRTRIESFAIESALTVLEKAAIESISCERVGCCKKKGFDSICRKKALILSVEKRGICLNNRKAV